MKPIQTKPVADTGTDVQTSALGQVVDAAAATIPPVPGGGSWRWTGTEWISNDPPQDAAATQPTNQE